MGMYYAIEIIGYGAKARYTIKDVWKEGGRLGSITLHPVKAGQVFRTKEAAMEAAESMGITIDKIGTFYEII